MSAVLVELRGEEALHLGREAMVVSAVLVEGGGGVPSVRGVLPSAAGEVVLFLEPVRSTSFTGEMPQFESEAPPSGRGSGVLLCVAGKAVLRDGRGVVLPKGRMLLLTAGEALLALEPASTSTQSAASPTSCASSRPRAAGITRCSENHTQQKVLVKESRKE